MMLEMRSETLRLHNTFLVQERTCVAVLEEGREHARVLNWRIFRFGVYHLRIRISTVSKSLRMLPMYSWFVVAQKGVR